MASLLEHPEAQELFKKLLVGLTEESPRGAVLVGFAHVDNCMHSLFEAVFPSQLGKEKRRSLLRYPGPLSSFSARIEIAYAIRLLPRDTYDCLDSLRKMRNDLAHSPESFELKGQEDRYQSFYGGLGQNLRGGIRMMAFEMMIDYKADIVLKEVQKWQGEEGDTGPAISTKREALDYMMKELDMLEAFERQLPHWELAIGLAALCGMIILHREKAVAALGPDATIDRLHSSRAGE